MGNDAVITGEDGMFSVNFFELAIFDVGYACAGLSIDRVDDGGVETHSHGTFGLIKGGVVKGGKCHVVGGYVRCHMGQQARNHEAHQTGIAIGPQRCGVITAVVRPVFPH